MKTIRGNRGKHFITLGRKDHFKQNQESKQHKVKN